jgi:hypothetical protein
MVWTRKFSFPQVYPSVVVSIAELFKQRTNNNDKIKTTNLWNGIHKSGKADQRINAS